MLQHPVLVTFFPYVLIGPLTRAGQVLPQFDKPHAAFVNTDNICRGVVVILVGLFKKAVLAAAFTRWANLGFDRAAAELRRAVPGAKHHRVLAAMAHDADGVYPIVMSFRKVTFGKAMVAMSYR